MKLLYIADGRSQIALNWISYFIRAGNEVHLASSFPCQPIEGLASLTVIPVALSGLYGTPSPQSAKTGHLLRRFVPVQLRTFIRQRLAPLSFNAASTSLQQLIERIQPDFVHAMRIPFEGMVASMALQRLNTAMRGKTPLLISVWGNDFTLHAESTLAMLHFTRQSLQSADGLHTDCQRDQRLAIQLGFDPARPAIVLPGGGGVDLGVFYPPDQQVQVGAEAPAIGGDPLTIINSRGFRAYVRNDTFFHALPLVLQKYPQAHFICPSMQGEVQADKWCRELGIADKVELLPDQSPSEMAELFRRSLITLSVTTHDGTPNTLLEAMACGCFPIVGDLESLREWITPGVNGLLVDPSDPTALARAILTAIQDTELRKSARIRNLALVRQRAEHTLVMHAAEDFYVRLISSG